MEFPFDLRACVGVPSGHGGPCLGYIDDRLLQGRSGGPLCTVLEELGKRSAVAQGLRKPVTFGSASALGDQRVYLLVDGRAAVGFLKVGAKRLFVSAPPAAAARGAHKFADVQGTFREIEPLCALDFYVHESCQRSGFGRHIFDAMLERERAAPSRLGYDRPSPKLLAFLKKQYGLSKFQPQNNNFVVFDSYFEPDAEAAAPSRRSLCSGNDVFGSAGVAAASDRRSFSGNPGHRCPAASPIF